jgi:glycosyltransferase involved in cell wall biosynthesis
MDSLKVSVVIPTYNAAQYLTEAVQSVLDQTYSNLEVIVVNDASTDRTDEVMGQFNDPRVKYIVHPENRYAAAARNTGIRASTGMLIAFLDADDYVHPEKLYEQVAFLKQNPDIGLTYNSRIEVDESSLPVSFKSAQPVVTLSDLVLSFPYAPSEVVMRKEWAERVGLFDESFVLPGEDPDFFMRLALRGCLMAGVDKVLTYRRLHKNRVFRNLADGVEEEFRAFENTFADPDCPPEVVALREKSLGKLHLILSCIAFNQNETALGQDLIRKAIQYDRALFNERTEGFVKFLIMFSVRDGGDHETVLERIFSQLPSELAWATSYSNYAIAYGYPIRGARDIMWDRIEQGQAHFARAAELRAHLDEFFLNDLFEQLLCYEKTFGDEALEKVLKELYPCLEEIGDRSFVRHLASKLALNRAFKFYYAGNYSGVTREVAHAVSSQPRRIFNLGVISIYLRSLMKSG